LKTIFQSTGKPLQASNQPTQQRLVFESKPCSWT